MILQAAMTVTASMICRNTCSRSRNHSGSRQYHLLVITALFLLLIQQIYALQSSPSSSYGSSSSNNNSNDMSSDGNGPSRMAPSTTSSSSSPSIRVAHLGNSIQYYNDCPRFLQRMLEATQQFENVYQNSCLRGGATLPSLFEKGNGMRTKFGQEDMGAPTVVALLTEDQQQHDNDDGKNNAAIPWDFIILNDHTQGPAREEKKNATLLVLKEKYVPLFPSKSIIVILQTAAYRYPDIHNSQGLGDFEEFTERVRSGCIEYVNATPNAVLAPVGTAFAKVKLHDVKLWERLYARDDFHPGPHGTYLEACVLYCTMLQKVPPVYDSTWWDTARYMQPPDVEPLPLPTDEEASVLRRIACETCQVDMHDEDEGASSRL